jgi:hypothetical protein
MIREDGADFKPAGLFVVVIRKMDAVIASIPAGAETPRIRNDADSSKNRRINTSP